MTGDADKRVRDCVRDEVNKRRKQPYYVRLLDKIAFTLGVLNISLSQYFLFSQPSLFWAWYSVVIPILWAVRAREFGRRKYAYFLFDFCYFVLGGTLLNILVLPNSKRLFKILFIFTHGPLALAVLIWRCSLVFHDIERITSVYIHILPAMLYYTQRWEVPSIKPVLVGEVYTTDELSMEDYLLALVTYISWQVLYFLKTEVVDRYRLDSDPEYITSLRWMTRDTKHILARSVLHLMRWIGAYGPDESYDASSLKTKFTFMAVQLVYTVVSFSIAHFVYYSKTANLIFIIALFIISVYLGGSYYIDVFSNYYQLQFSELVTGGAGCDDFRPSSSEEQQTAEVHQD